MLQPPEHQVAGHSARGGGLGPLVDGAGLFYKPLQSDDRGANEVSFYTSFSADPRVPPHIRRFFPAFHGTQLLRASDGSGLHPHLVLEDLLAGLSRPSVIDLKIGSRTWYLAASDDYIRKCVEKDRESTSIPIGFRISGLQIYDGAAAAGFHRPRREEVKRFTTRVVRRALRQFVSTNPSGDAPNSALASAIYGGSDGVLAQLLELKAWFEDQTLFHFYSVSVLMAYERDGGAGEGQPTKPRVKLVDFAHVLEGDGVIDHNFLGGLCSLIKFVSEILTDPDEQSAGGRCRLSESKKASSCFDNGSS